MSLRSEISRGMRDVHEGSKRKSMADKSGKADWLQKGDDSKRDRLVDEIMKYESWLSRPTQRRYKGK